MSKKNKMKLGQFIIGDSVIHKLDPRAKIIGTFFIISSAIFSSNPIVALVNLFILISAVKLTGISVFKFLSRMKSLFILFACTFIFQSILTQGDVIFHIIGRINVTKQGILLGIITVVRLVTIYICSTILTTTTSPMKLTSGLEALFSPLKVLHFPVNELAMIISISLRFIPTIIEEAEVIRDAQRSRGAQFESRNIIIKLKSTTAILIPVLAASLQRAGELATAMESRCYTAGSTTRNTERINFKKKDVLAVLSSSLSLVLCFIMS